MFRNRPEPEKVFTPRAAEINTRMYIDRPILEARLSQALRGSKYIVIHGESGNGKTWLYKRVFAKEGVSWQVLNLANVIALKGFSAAFEAKLGELDYTPLQTKTFQTDGGIRPWGVGVHVQDAQTTKVTPLNPFVALLSEIRRLAGRSPAALVFDNFEALTEDQDALKGLASIIISADDEAVSKLDVRLLIVGVPGDIRALVARAGHASTISNRLTEIPEIARMTVDEAKSLMKTGLEDELGLIISFSKEEFYNNLCFLTDRIAQQIHELCLKLAYGAIAAGNLITEDVLRDAEKSWAEDTLSADWTVIQALMNVNESSAGRKNQLLYALGRHDFEDFRYSDIEKILRAEFPTSTQNVGLNIAGMLTSFSTSNNALLRRTPNQDAYRFVSPKLRMAIRTRLRKTSSETVEKVF